MSLCRLTGLHTLEHRWVKLYHTPVTDMWELHWVCAECAKDVGPSTSEVAPHELRLADVHLSPLDAWLLLCFSFLPPILIVAGIVYYFLRSAQ